MTGRQLPPRFKGETQKAYQAFADFLSLGSGRSLEKLLHCYRGGRVSNPPTRRLATLENWAMACAWELRAQRWEEQRKERQHATAD